MPLSFTKAVQLLHRPHLIMPDVAETLAQRIRELDPEAFRRRVGPFALFRKLGQLGARAKPQAMEDDEIYTRPPMTAPNAYAPPWLGKPDDELEWGMTLKDGVALLNIDSPLAEHGEEWCGAWMHGYDSIAAAIDTADADPRARAMFIRIDSPGGVASQSLYDLSARLAARGADAKPIWAYCDLAASAAYMLAVSCSRVVAPALGLVGSIGAVLVHESLAGRYEQMGVKVTAIQFGAQKTDGAHWKDLSEESRADLQAMIDQLGEMFLARVDAGPGAVITGEQARATQARVFNASHSDASRSGLALGLVADVMGEAEAFAALRDSVAGAIIPVAIAPGKPAARAASPMEKPMKLRAAIAALTAKAKAEGESDETLKTKIRKLIEEDDAAEAEAADGEEEDPDAEGDGEGEPAGDEPAPEDDAEEDDAPAARTGRRRAAAVVDPKVAQAVLDLPEAKGREALAKRLAFKPGMTLAEAKADLAAAPKASSLSTRMRDADLSASGGRAASEEDQLIEAGFAAAGIRPRQRRAG